MPVIRSKDAPVDRPQSAHPVLGSYEARLISDAGGLTQFGAFTETLPPGSRSSLKHWHMTEDEMIYVLSGELTLHEGAAVTTLLPGDAACFAAGVAQGHFLENRSLSEVTYLVIGTRSKADVITFPEHDTVLHFDRENGTRTYVTPDGKPAKSPY
jgi:uncharacterized cupin superfamily protein